MHLKKLLLILFISFSFISLVTAHSGRTDSSGGHNNRSTGTYHYHNSGSSSSGSYSNSYSGNCPCPYDTASDGSICGARSAWSRSGGASPVCYGDNSNDGGNSNAYIKSRIDGEFNGFGYGNIYFLTNGQIWIQTDSKKANVYKYRPKVTIFNGHMRVEGLMHSVRVSKY